MKLKMRLRQLMVVKKLSMLNILWKSSLTHDNFPLNKLLRFLTMTIIARSVFEEAGKFYPQIYLDECLYEL